MLVIFKNNWRRLLVEKAYIIVSVILTLFSLSAAILITDKAVSKGNIAVVTSEKSVSISDSKYFNVTIMDNAPAKSELVQGRYNAIVKINDGKYSIDTIGNDDFKSMLMNALENPKSFVPDMTQTRKVGTNIIGFIMMFLLIQGVLFARFFAEDKEKAMIKRVAMSPIAFTKYILGQAAFIAHIIFIPSFLIILSANFIGINIGFSILQYAILLAIMSFLSTSFALFLNSFFCVSDTANMLGSALITLTTILAGSFYSFDKKETLFNKVLHVLPQKDFMNFTDALEKGNVTNNLRIQISYVLLISLVFICVAIVKTRKDYVRHK